MPVVFAPVVCLILRISWAHQTDHCSQDPCCMHMKLIDFISLQCHWPPCSYCYPENAQVCQSKSSEEEGKAESGEEERGLAPLERNNTHLILVFEINYIPI